ncbi:MAG: alpha-hydroxy acid oxidase [Acidimicrobiia bacterium]
MGVLDTIRSVVRLRPIELDGPTRRLRGAATIEDLRVRARRRLPRGVFDYIDGGSDGERTLAANAAALAGIELHPRVLVGVGSVDTRTSVLGRELPLPLVMAPTGMSRIAHPDGELAVARAAARNGLPYTLSTVSTRTIEEVAEAGTGPRWFQLYLPHDRGLGRALVERAAAAGYEVLALTVDTPVLGRRNRDVRQGVTLPPSLGLRTLIDGLVHPAWTWEFVRSEPMGFANLAPGASSYEAAAGASATVGNVFDPDLSWSDVEWLRSIWDGPLLLKGVQSPADAVLAADHGVDGVVVSNHGGRQLDTAPPAITSLGPIVDAAGDRLEVLFDSGIRYGSDVVKALALGARACLVGRAYLYGLGVAGEKGVDHAIGLLRDDVVRTMALLGVTSVAGLTRAVLEPATGT